MTIDKSLVAYLDPMFSGIIVKDFLDEFDIRYAKKIWPSVTENTPLLFVFGVEKKEFTMFGLEGSETISLIDCNEARFIKWGYAPKHDLMVIIERDYPHITSVAKWEGMASEPA